MEAAKFYCNLEDRTNKFDHFFEHTVGSGHATLALRADWQKQIKRCHDEIGFQHVRFHGILSDDMGTLVDEMDQLVYSFFNADQIMDFLVSIGMKPFVELSFMPLALSSGDKRVFHYQANVTPPKDYNAWSSFIKKLVAHWIDRYGIEEVSTWFFEVWNEPNLEAFWTGSQADYFKLYQHTAAAIKEVNISLKVGGPATASNSWIKEFTSFCHENSVPFDFISTHHYPTDAFGQPGDDTITQLSKSRRSVLREEVTQVNTEAEGKPVYYTEWCTSSNPFDELHDQSYAAAFITKTVIEAQGQVKGYSYWTFSDIFEENYFSSVPFHGGFGLLTIYGIPKPSYRAYQLLHHLGNEILAMQGKHDTVDAWAFKRDKKIQIMITNWALPRHDIKEEQVVIMLLNTKTFASIYVERIDEQHVNTRKAWENMGSPESLSPEQVKSLEQISQLVKEDVIFTDDGSEATITIDMPVQALACVTIELQ